MKIGRGLAVRRDLGQLFEGQSVAGMGEVQLLERFVERGDGPAFAALVARHGPMVLGVCRRLLVDPFDVEDAFQATFLVLARRASSIRDGDRLAPWLFGVARKVATRARADLSRRRAREQPYVEAVAIACRPDDPTRELGRALVEEIDRLPGPLREPILLCCVEGLTYDEAASQLRSTAPAIRGRLARARTRLKDQLTRRGFAPTVGALGALLTTEAASAAVPARLLTTTIQVAKAGAVPAIVEILAEGVIRTMILTKSKILAAAVVACGIAGSGMGLVAQEPNPLPRADEKTAQVDRLEKKLDRLIEALEGKIVTPPPPVVVGKLAVPPVPPKPPAHLKGLNSISPDTNVDVQVFMKDVPDGTNVDIEAITKQAIEQAKKATGFIKRDGTFTLEKDGKRIVVMPQGITIGPDVPPDARFAALEKKIDELQARIVKLERKLGAASESSDIDPGTGRPVGLKP